MIFLSAQPDRLYFKWQLEVQLVNFKKLGVSRNNIHILIGYNPKTGLQPKFLEFFETFRDYALFFIYEDSRKSPVYEPSLRPHIIKKHFIKNPGLIEENIFYHDADIIFRELPDFDALCHPEDESWYLSDTKSYISAECLKSKGRIVFEEMCEVMNVNSHLIELNNRNSGGAQYLMKGVNYQFWDKIEYDCERLYEHLIKNAARYADNFVDWAGSKVGYSEIISWCADMWAVLWNAIELGYKLQIHPDLDFCWPYDDLDKWESKKIFHNAGLGPEHSHEFFYKGDFEQLPPYNISFDYVLKDKCTRKYVEAVLETQQALRSNFRDMTFLIPIRIDSEDRLSNLKTSIAYLNKNCCTNIIVLEADREQRVNPADLPDCVTYHFVEDKSHWFHRTRYNNEMIKMSQTPFIALYDADIIVPLNQMELALNILRSGKSKIVFPYDGQMTFVSDEKIKSHFIAKLDIKILGSLKPSQYYSVGGVVFFDKQTFIDCGMENEAIYKWGPEDQERVRRLELLGFEAARVDGAAFHIDHVTLHNSGYASADDYCELMEMQFSVLRMNKTQLEEFVSIWK